jgi:carboxyl-terminal processing protease
MKNLLKIYLLALMLVFGLPSCTDNDDKLLENSNTEVQNFIWRGLNNYYLWQQDVPDLSDNKFQNPYALNDFIATKGTPENTFQQLLYKPVSLFPDVNGVVYATDRFSVLVDDYVYLENLFQGIRKTSGLSIELRYKSGTSGPIVGFVKYIVPNSDASTKNVKRGDVFYAVNGNLITDSNSSSLFANDNFTINFANYNNGNFTPNGIDIAFTKTQITENPVFINNIINVGSKKIAYLMYNSFTSNFNTELNNAFGQIKSSNATDLVLDLRYNGGGSIQTATYLASMITGQFNNQVFAKEIWNTRIQNYYESNSPQQLENLFTDNISGIGINSLNLNKVYILTTKRTASASELVINGLKPYIQVIQIGTTTIGKNAGSVTLYDSKNFSKTGINTNHKYAMQPLVLKTANKDGFGDYQTGLVPNYLLSEDVGNLGILGNSNEPLLKKAIDLITFRNRNFNKTNIKILENVKSNSRDFNSEMYLEKLPLGFEKAIE